MTDTNKKEPFYKKYEKTILNIIVPIVIASASSWGVASYNNGVRDAQIKALQEENKELKTRLDKYENGALVLGTLLEDIKDSFEKIKTSQKQQAKMLAVIFKEKYKIDVNLFFE